MIYRVVHVTEYAYTDPVATSHHLLHLAPRDTERQVCRWEQLSVTPPPTSQAERLDHFGNRTTYFEMQEPHRQLTVESRRDVELLPLPAPSAEGGPAWETVRDLVRQPSNTALLEACEMTYPSPFVRISDDVLAFAKPSFPRGRPLLDAVADLTHRIYEDLAYDQAATNVSTPVDEVLRLRRGVCQDFTHLEIACLRALGLPARYVSGYLVTMPVPGKPKLVGADASHAWLAVYCPDVGWVPTDPTNDVVPDQRHITVAWGRDFGDVTPMRGVIVGGSRHDLRVSVDVSPLDGREEGDDVQPASGAISERGDGGGDDTTGGSGTSANAERQSE